MCQSDLRETSEINVCIDTQTDMPKLNRDNKMKHVTNT